MGLSLFALPPTLQQLYTRQKMVGMVCSLSKTCVALISENHLLQIVSFSSRVSSASLFA